MKKGIGILLFLMLLIYFIQSNMSIMAFIDPVSILLIIIGSAVLAYVKFDKGDGRSKICQSLRRYFILWGIMISLIGLCMAGFNLDEPRHIGPVIAISLLPMIYGLVLACIADAFVR